MVVSRDTEGMRMSGWRNRERGLGERGIQGLGRRRREEGGGRGRERERGEAGKMKGLGERERKGEERK